MRVNRRSAAITFTVIVAVAAVGGAARMASTAPLPRTLPDGPVAALRDRSGDVAPPRLSWPSENPAGRVAVTFRTPIRNPFVLGREAVRQRQRSPAARATEVDVPVAASNPDQAVTLIGVSETAAPDGLIRTAILSGKDDHFWIVRRGDSLNRYERVDSVGPDNVTLIDTRTGSVRLLRLQ